MRVPLDMQPYVISHCVFTYTTHALARSLQCQAADNMPRFILRNNNARRCIWKMKYKSVYSRAAHEFFALSRAPLLCSAREWR